ncbi:MAG: PAS domain-containing protein, partial [Alphaproteobacteria bacterium]|nr:PAS domain-containing protein [Alphaproteobacteria bacterium]
MNEVKKRDSFLIMQRFVALAFCRADLLFELDHSHNILFSAGTTKELLGKNTEEIYGQSFFDFIDERDWR